MFQTSSSDLAENPGLSAIGTNAVPFLAEALRIQRTRFDRHPWLQRAAVHEFLTNFSSGFTWTHSATAVQRAAAFSLLTFGFDAQPALSALHEAVVNPTLDDSARQNVVTVLAEIGPLPESLPFLVAAWPLTKNEFSPVRHDLLLVLSRIARHSPERCLPIFLTEVSSTDEDIRNAAVWGLGAVGQLAHQGVPAVTALLQGTNSYAQFAAAVVLGRITNRVAALVPRLQELAQGTNAQPAAGAALTLFRWGEPVEKSVAILTNLLSDQKAKGLAAEYLGQIGPAARSALPALILGCQQDIGAWVDQYDRARCALAVLQISGSNEIAIRELKAALVYQPNSWVRYAVARDLGKAGKVAHPLKDALEQNLKDTDANARRAAAVALQQWRE